MQALSQLSYGPVSLRENRSGIRISLVAEAVARFSQRAGIKARRAEDQALCGAKARRMGKST